MVQHSIDGSFVYEVPIKLPGKDVMIESIYRHKEVFRPGLRTGAEALKFLTENGVHTFKPGPGIQSNISYSNCRYLTMGTYLLTKKILEFNNTVNNKKGEDIYSHWWYYLSYPDNPDTDYHNHKKFNNGIEHFDTTWTCTYYLKLPNNCTGDEGKILFSKNKDDKTALKLFPKLDTAYVFPAHLEHKPFLAPNTTEDRLVVAGNVYIPFVNKSLM